MFSRSLLFALGAFALFAIALSPLLTAPLTSLHVVSTTNFGLLATMLTALIGAVTDIVRSPRDVIIVLYMLCVVLFALVALRWKAWEVLLPSLIAGRRLSK